MEFVMLTKLQVAQMHLLVTTETLPTATTVCVFTLKELARSVTAMEEWPLKTLMEMESVMLTKSLVVRTTQLVTTMPRQLMLATVFSLTATARCATATEA